jgi:hypothetical protein
MVIKRIAASAAVAVGLAGSGLLFSQAWLDPSPAAPATVHSTDVSMDAVVARAADKAGLVMLCEKGRLDAAAEALYRATAQAHPDLAVDIGSDCRVESSSP